MPLGHLGINVTDLDLARTYYGRVMPALGYEVYLEAPDELAFRPADGKIGTYLFVYPAQEDGGYSRQRTGLQHLAFIVKTRADVQLVHDLAVELGSEIVHPPQEFPQYPPPYHATFWLDPFGFLLEAVCHHDRD